MVKFEVGKKYPDACYTGVVNYEVLSRVHNPKNNADYIVVIKDCDWDLRCQLYKILESDGVEYVDMGNGKTDFACCYADSRSFDSFNAPVEKIQQNNESKETNSTCCFALPNSYFCKKTS